VSQQSAVMISRNIDQLCINTIRTLSIDGVQQANSRPSWRADGSGAGGVRIVAKIFEVRPCESERGRIATDWCCPRGTLRCCCIRRCILPACGLTRQKEKCRRSQPSRWMRSSAYRQLDSKTPGHPESHITSGVETTTGPLGQGAGNSVGMAIASKWLAANYNQAGFEIFDFKTYAVCGDGDLMEGVASEAASLAGHLRLGNLCWIYDNNRVTLDGPASWSFSEDVMTRFVGYGWNVTRVCRCQ